MTALRVEETALFHNPLDIVEDIVATNNWIFERNSDDEMLVETVGKWCHYRLYFLWQREISALQFSCQFDLKVPPARRPAVFELLTNLNHRLWLGHFDLCPHDQTPMFRHATLYRGARGASVEQVEDMVEIALAESERYYPSFQFVIWGGKSASEAIEASILDTVGQA